MTNPGGVALPWIGQSIIARWSFLISITPDFAETLPTAYPWLAGVPVCTRWIRMDIGGESFTIEP